ncbi:hypothetical protein ACK9YZ_23325 [Rhizobium sp. ZK1]|uniref:hypothetical protein n=1 Tax=Rhizobium sp. ZK1 TaxID=3389872 RepID=UPI0039F73BC4
MTANWVWKKRGRLFVATGERHPKLLTHQANPLAVHLENDIFRIFYSGRDCENRSSVGAVDIEIPTGIVVCDHIEPFVVHGPAGSFYEAGISIGNDYRTDGDRFILFMGWQNKPGDHWRGDIGRLKVTPEINLEIFDRHPYLASDPEDRVSLSYPWVRQHNHDYQMWYGSTETWDGGNGEMVHVIKGAVSSDGRSWRKTGLAVPYILGVAQAFSRPTVIRLNDGIDHMWFSYRAGDGSTYRIGHAQSADDGLTWTLALDALSIQASESGWDSEMIEYPFVFGHKGAVYMLYNGNGFGKSGFGLAALEGH